MSWNFLGLKDWEPWYKWYVCEREYKGIKVNAAVKVNMDKGK